MPINRSIEAWHNMTPEEKSKVFLVRMRVSTEKGFNFYDECVLTKRENFTLVVGNMVEDCALRIVGAEDGSAVQSAQREV